MKDLRVTKIVKEITFGKILVELESKEGFQRQSFIIYLRLTLVFMRHSELREKFNFQESFASINKIFILAETLHIRLFSMKFRHFPHIS